MKIKKYGNKKRSLNFHDKPISQNLTYCLFIPACASEQGNVIELVSVYIFILYKKNCNPAN